MSASILTLLLAAAPVLRAPYGAQEPTAPRPGATEGASQTAPHPLTLGASDWLEIAPGDPGTVNGWPTRVLHFTATSGDRATFTALSFDFDVYLQLRSEGGDVIIDEDEDGGFETNARLANKLMVAGRTYQVLVSAHPPGTGSFRVIVERGNPPKLKREQLVDQGILFHDLCAERAQERGDGPAVASHLESKARYQIELEQFPEARDALSRALSRWEQKGDRKRAAAVELELGLLDARLGDAASSDRHLSAALAEYTNTGDAAGRTRALLAIAQSREKAGDAGVAMERCQEALAVASKAGDSPGKLAALSLLEALHTKRGDVAAAREAIARSGDAHRDMRELDQAVAKHTQALEMARAADDRAAQAGALADLGDDRAQERDWSRTRVHYEEALAMARAIGERRVEVRALAGLGRVWFGIQDYRKSLQLHEQELALATELGSGIAAAQLQIGMCCIAIQDWSRARKSLETAALAAREAGAKLAELQALTYLVLVETEDGKEERAETLQLQVRALQLGGEETPLTLLAECDDQLRRGDYTRAKRGFAQALELATTRGDPWMSTLALYGLAQCAEIEGKYGQAISYLDEYVQIVRSLGQRVNESEGLEQLGVQHWRIGALDTALDFLEQSLSISRDLGSEPPDVLNSIANVWLDLEDHDRALETYERVLTLARKDRLIQAEAASLNNVGVVHWRRREYAESRKWLEQAVAMSAENRDAPLLAESNGNLARVLRKLGQKDRAEELARASMEYYDEPGALGRRQSLAALSALAGLAIDAGDATEAQSAIRRADDVIRSMVREARASGAGAAANPWHLCTAFDRHAQDLTRVRALDAGSTGPEHPAILAEGFRAADRARSRQLTMGVVERRRGAVSPEMLRRRRELRNTSRKLSDALSRLSIAVAGAQPSEIVSALRAEIKELRTRSDELNQVLLSQAAPANSDDVMPDGAGPDAVRRAAIVPGRVLIEYAEGEDDLYAYVVTAEGLQHVLLGPRKPIDEAVERYLAMISSQEKLASVAEIAEAGAALHGFLLRAPIDAAGKNLERILVVPTPSLATLPFDALVVLAEKSPRTFADVRFAIDQWQIDYCPSGSILVQLAERGERKLSGRVLVLADPVYPGEATEPAAVEQPSAAADLLGGTRAAPDPLQFQRLQKTHDEAFAIADAIVPQNAGTEVLADLARARKSRSAHFHDKLIDVWTGTHASRDRLASDMRDCSYLHLAAHGYIDRELPQNSGIGLTSPTDGAYQGFFTIADAAELDLPAELVVLSACDTARGRVRVGEGVESMAGAFLSAGARGVIASLWQVEDRAAAQTMESLYGGMLGKKLVAPAALRAAKLEIRRGEVTRGMRPGGGAVTNEGHPNAWAPFIYIGRPHASLVR